MSIIYFEIGFYKNNWYPQPWNIVFVISGVVSIILILITMVIFPMFNKKNPGQTIGKKLLKITILNLEEGNIKLKIFLREIPLSFLYMLPILLQLISGIEAKHLFIMYSKQNEEYNKNIFDFLFNVLPNGIDGVKNIFMWQSIVNLTSVIVGKIEMFVLIGISISIIASPKNIAVNDKYLKWL